MNKKILADLSNLFSNKLNAYKSLSHNDKDKLTVFSSFANGHNIEWLGEEFPWQESLLLDIEERQEQNDMITIVGASTSFGKSHVMRKFSIKSSSKRILFLLQEKSLINDYEREFDKFYKGVEINTYMNSKNMNDDGIFVLTQERFLAVDITKIKDFDVVVIDEAQWINSDIIDIFNNDGTIQKIPFSLRRVKKFVEVLRVLGNSKIFALIPSHNRTLAEKTASVYSGITGKDYDLILENFNITSRSGVTLNREELNYSWTNENVIPNSKKIEIEEHIDKMMNNANFIPKQTLVYLSKKKTYKMIEDGMVAGNNTESNIYKKVSKIYGSSHPQSIFISNRKAYHNGNIYPTLRKEIEESFIKDEIDIIFANQTIIKGVNIAPKYLLMRTDYFSWKAGYNYIKASNLFGRTGRISGERHGIVIIDLKKSDIFVQTLEENEGIKEQTEDLIIGNSDKRQNLGKVLDLISHKNFSSAEFDKQFKDVAKNINGEKLSSYNDDFYSAAEHLISNASGKDIDSFVENAIMKLTKSPHKEIKKLIPNLHKYLVFMQVSAYEGVSWESKDEAFLRWNNIFDMIFEIGITKYELNDSEIALLSKYRYLISKGKTIKTIDLETKEKITSVTDVYDLIGESK